MRKKFHSSRKNVSLYPLINTSEGNCRNYWELSASIREYRTLFFHAGFLCWLEWNYLESLVQIDHHHQFLLSLVQKQKASTKPLHLLLSVANLFTSFYVFPSLCASSTTELLFVLFRVSSPLVLWGVQSCTIQINNVQIFAFPIYWRKSESSLGEYINKQKQTPWSLVRKRVIPTERPQLVDEI
jgi:hypothetical protein